MPPTRRQLATISGNRLPKQHLTPYMRGRIAGHSELGATSYQIASNLNVPRSTVQYTIKQDPLRNEGATIPKAPRGKSYTPIDERAILRYVRCNPKHTYKQVIAGAGVSCSTTTIKKILKKYGITN